MTQEVIVIKQLPVIEEQLRQIKESVEASTAEALSLVCTEETYKSVKAARAALSKDFEEFEKRRKEVKAQILAPYEQFEKIYRECITEPYKAADRELAGKIQTTEGGLKRNKEKELLAYYREYLESVSMSEEDAPIGGARIAVTLSASLKSLKERVKAYIDETREDMAMLATRPLGDEYIAEYRRCQNASQAILVVDQRHREIEAERARAEERRAAEEARKAAVAKVDKAVEEAAPQPAETPQDAFAPPVEEDAPATETANTAPAAETETIYEATFTVRGNLAQIRALKKFLEDGGYDYE